MDAPICEEHNLHRIRIIATDLDGTFLDTNHSISSTVIDAVHELESHASIPVYISTGRCRASALSKFKEAGLDWSSRPGVFLNGAVVYGDDGNIIFEKRFDIEVLEAVASKFQGDLNRAVVMPCSGDTVHSPQLCALSMHLNEEYSDPLPVDHGSYEKMIERFRVDNLSIHMISIATADCRETEKIVVKRLKEVLSEYGDLESFAIVTPIPRLVTVLPRNTSKGEGVVALCRWLSVDPLHAAAIGDSNNDIEMIRMVGVGVAVGNAKEDVKKHAKLIVNRNDDSELPGVAHLARLVLQSRIALL